MILLRKSLFTTSLALLFMVAVNTNAQNPFVQTCFTTDPAPMVHDGTLYVYTGHDEDGADFFWMQESRVYSTQDMVNWTDHGSPLALEDFGWADDRAWASQCVERDGKFYWYICAHSKISNGMAIGVAVGDTPTGPFHDALLIGLLHTGDQVHAVAGSDRDAGILAAVDRVLQDGQLSFIVDVALRSEHVHFDAVFLRIRFGSVIHGAPEVGVGGLEDHGVLFCHGDGRNAQQHADDQQQGNQLLHWGTS